MCKIKRFVQIPKINKTEQTYKNLTKTQYKGRNVTDGNKVN